MRKWNRKKIVPWILVVILLLGAHAWYPRPVTIVELYRMLELGGEDVIACGSDFDGGITSQMDNPALFASFGDYMVDHGISRRVSDKIMFENALHFFEENIK